MPLEICGVRLLKGAEVNLLNAEENRRKTEEQEGLKSVELDEQIERYYELDKQLEKLNDEYDTLNEETDKLYGQAKLDNIDE